MIIDMEQEKIISNDKSTIQLYSPEGFKVLSELWIKVGWDQQYSYSFSWLGRPIIQNTEDMIRAQEVIYSVKPDIIIETGIAHGGSLIYYASILHSIGHGRVVGVDIEIRPHNRKAIEEHALSHLIDVIEGNSIDTTTIEQVKDIANTGNKVIVFLDSAHDYEHVSKELELYSELISIGSFIIVCDGIRGYLHTVPKAKRDFPDEVHAWHWSNPKNAAEDFVSNNPSFEIVEPEFPFNEGNVKFRVTYWPSAFVLRVS